MNTNIVEDSFNEQTYIKHNATLAYEDVEYKFYYIKSLLDSVEIKNNEVFLLDVGGGGGFLGKKIAEYFIQKEIKVHFYALDVSSKMLEIQQHNNPYITDVYNCYLEDLEEKKMFDIVFMIDVIEHIPNKNSASKKISSISKYALYNIPTEINLFDLLKNILMKNRYYKIQGTTLGHVHFLSYFGAKNHFKKFFTPIKWVFPNYAEHILYSNTNEFDSQRNNKFRRFELICSDIVYKYLRIFAPLINQGSLFILGISKNEK